jgi:hypothetical protein
MVELEIPSEARPYLQIQIGAIARIADPKKWYEAVCDFIDDQIGSLTPALLPASDKGGRLLSIGAGMGHIELVIQRCWSQAGQTLVVEIVDGTDDKPVVKYHREPFSNAAAADIFWKANGGVIDGYYNPGTLPKHLPQQDIILGLGSWGFHFSPETYLKWVLPMVHAETVLVMDVRKRKPEWKARMSRYFDQVQVLQEDEKRERIWWKLKSQ